MKTLILVNTLSSVNSFIYGNHVAFFAGLKKSYPNDKFFHFNPNRMSIDHARNIAARMAMEQDCDYLMFLDDDVMVPPADTFQKLLECNSDIAAGLVIIRGFPFHVMGFKFTKDSTPEEPRIEYYDDLPLYCNDNECIDKDCSHPKDVRGIVDVAAVGFSCALIKVSLLRELEPPFFVTGTNCTEDVYFCLKAIERTEGKVTIRMNTELQPGHLMPSEPVEWKTISKFKAFYKQTQEANQDPRNLQFLQHVLKSLE